MDGKKADLRAGVFLLVGASGCGKSTLIKLLTGVNCDDVFKYRVSIHQKGVTRSQQFGDGIELKCGLTEQDIEKDYIGTTFGGNEDFKYGNKGYAYYQIRNDQKIVYAIQRSQIDRALDAGKAHIILCNNVNVIKQIKNDYPETKVIFMKFDAPRQIVEAYIKEEFKNTHGTIAKKINIQERVKNIHKLDKLFNEQTTLFDGVLLNKYGANYKELLSNQIKFLLNLPNELPQPESVFVIMPFEKTLDLNNALANYKQASTYMQSINDLPLQAARADSLYKNGSAIINKIYEGIEKASVVIADLTNNRPNCYYELGYARALKKDIMLFAKEGTKLEFDESGYDCYFYNEDNEEEFKQSICKNYKAMGYKSKK